MGGSTFERITVDPEPMDGVPCIRDLRVTLSMVLGQLATDRTVEQLLADYPYLESNDVRAHPRVRRCRREPARSPLKIMRFIADYEATADPSNGPTTASPPGRLTSSS